MKAHPRAAEGSPVPKFLSPVFAKTSPKRSFSMIDYERFGLNFAKTGSINSGTGDLHLSCGCSTGSHRGSPWNWEANSYPVELHPAVMEIHLGAMKAYPGDV
jgi:hypothetical protein